MYFPEVERTNDLFGENLPNVAETRKGDHESRFGIVSFPVGDIVPATRGGVRSGVGFGVDAASAA